MTNGKKQSRQRLKSSKDIDLMMIDPPEDVARIEIPPGDIRELAESIKERGLLQDIGVAERDGRYEVVWGHRRYLAYKYLKYKTISCKIVESDPKVIALARATENILTKDLSPLEEGMIYHGMIEKLGMTLDEIGERMGVSPGVVKRRINVLKMPDSLIEAIHKRLINQTVAEEIMRCPDESYRAYLIEMSRDHGAKMLVVRGWVDDYLQQLRRKASGKREGSPSPDVYVETPIYFGCTGCTMPCDVTKQRIIRVCPECEKHFVEIVRAGQWPKRKGD